MQRKHEERNINPTNKKKDTNVIGEYVVKNPMPLMEFLMLSLKGKSRNNIKSLLSRKQVAIDGAPVSQFDFMLARGDVVMIGKHSFKMAKEKRSSLDIIYEDDEFIVINKPSGLLSIASDNEKGQTAYHLLMDYYRKDDKHNRIFVVHRIDRDTSGVLMVAKNETIRDQLQEVWNDIVTKRGYYAIVEGKVKEKEKTIKSWLKQNSTNLMYSSSRPGDGQLSITHYKVMKQNDNYSLLDVHIDSGRKNQIRVHMKEMGHPIIGDDKYGNKNSPLNRLGLHAYELEFKHPNNGKIYRFVAPMPKEFNNINMNNKNNHAIENNTKFPYNRNKMINKK